MANPPLYDLSYSPATAHGDAAWSVFTVRVWPNRTQVHVTAAPGADPETILRQAISALEAELTALGACPIHQTKSNKYHALSIEDIADERWRDPSTADPVALLLAEAARLAKSDDLEDQRLARGLQDAAELLGGGE